MDQFSWIAWRAETAGIGLVPINVRFVTEVQNLMVRARLFAGFVE